jgi:hypothetical protein
MPVILTNPAASVEAVTPYAEIAEQIEQVFLQLLKDTGTREIKRIIQTGLFKNPTGALAASIQGRIDGKNVIWFSDLDYAEVQDKGMRPQTMWWLQGKIVPITIYKFGGQTKIFRRASLKALLSGKFRHPGFPGKNFFSRGSRVAMAQVPQLMERASQAVGLIIPRYK